MYKQLNKNKHAYISFHSKGTNYIGGVMVSMLALSDRGFKPRSGQTKTIQLVFVASLLSTQH
jgi:hypothetical protein